MSRSLRQQERSRSALIAGLLIGSLLLVVLLSFQTHYAVRAHRELAEEVLTDYAALVADEFIRRSSVELGYYGFYPLVTALSGEQQLPELAKLRASDDARIARASALARSVFEYDRDSGNLHGLQGSMADTLAAWLTGELSSAEVSEDPYVIAHSFIEGRHVNVVYAAPPGTEVIRGFVIDDSTMPDWLETATNRQPLLPPSLGDGEIGNEHVFVELTTEDGEAIFRQGRYGQSSLFVEKSFSSEGPALYGGMTVRATIDPAVAGRLIIGGLPRSRLPILLGLWGLAALLIVLAIGLLRRERTLARLRSDFVSRVSHELRTPLTQIRMFAETLLLGRVRSDEERRRSLEVIDKEARRLAHLVENILQFSRSERGTVNLDLQPRPIFPLVRELADDFRPLMKNGRLVVSSDVNDDVRVNMDAEAFQQMLLNLLDNAIKYGPDGQEIGLTLSEADGSVTLEVADEGPGIPESERERIWDPYYRMTREKASAVAGTGIGLAVVRELARLHGAKVSVRAGDKGGTCFSIDFPGVKK